MKYNYIKIVNMLSIILIILLSSCSSEESVVPVFSVDIAADSFVPEGGSKTITLTSNISWSASSSADWLTVSPTKGTGGTTVTLSAAENNMPATRKGVVTLTSETGEAVKISVSQATRYQFQVDVMELTFSPVADTLEVSLTSKTSWEITSSRDWLTVNPGNGQSSSILTFVASSNKTRDERLAVVTLTPDIGDAIEISVTQDGVLFYTDVSEVSFSDSPGEKSITLMSNVSWEAASDANWLTIDPVNGINYKEGQINLTVLRNDTENNRFANITLTPEIGESITVSVMQKGSDYVSESFKYVASHAKGRANGDSEANAADFLRESFWEQVNNELKTKSVEVKFLPGDYSRAYDNKGLILKGIGNAENKLVISGNDDVIFHAVEGSSQIGNLIDIHSCQNILIRDLHFTGNGKLGYVLRIKSIVGMPPSQNITIEDCSWKDMLGVIYGATGSHSKGTTDITYKNCTFERVGIDSHSHMMYHAHSANKISITDCHFEDCTGDYVRFRDQCDYALVKNCVFIHNNRNNNFQITRPFIGVPLFNSRGDVGDEYFATNYVFTDNQFINNYSKPIKNAIYFLHWGFSPKEYNYLLTASEGSILMNGTSIEKTNLLKNNFNIDVNKIRITNNNFTGRFTNRVGLISEARYGATSKGWEGTAEIADLINKSDTPFEWER